MSYIGVKINGLIQKMAGMPLMDVALSNRSTNGVQNKVLKAKFDEIESALTVETVEVEITGDGTNPNKGATVTVPNLNGRKVIGVVGFGTSNTQYIPVSAAKASDNTVYAQCMKVSQTAWADTVTVTVTLLVLLSSY